MNATGYLWCGWLVVCASGCATSLYDWGSYEDSVARLSAADRFAPNAEIRQLEQELHETQASGKQVPPGKHAYLGYLYAQIGDRALAVSHFEAEKRLFPESAPFVDRLLARLS